mgnify:FL=1
MTESELIAPIQVQNLCLLGSSFRIADKPAQNMDQRLGLDIEVKKLDIDGAEGAVDMDLSVSTSLVGSENDDEEKMSAGLVVFISVRAALSQELSEAEAKEYLLSNAVSMAYAHAKSCVMTITGLSPMGAVVLPSIFPYAIAHDYLSKEASAD